MKVTSEIAWQPASTFGQQYAWDCCLLLAHAPFKIEGKV
jgi:hypothetical protein